MTLDISLPAELQVYVDEQVKAGRYTDSSQLIISALMLLRDREELKAKVAAGMEQANRGELVEWDPDAVWAEVEKRQAESKGKKAG